MRIEREVDFDDARARAEVQDGEDATAVLENRLVVRLLDLAKQRFVEAATDPAADAKAVEDLRRQYHELNAFPAILRQYVQTGVMAAQSLAEQREDDAS